MDDLIRKLIELNPEIVALHPNLQLKAIDLYSQGEIWILASNAQEIINFFDSEIRKKELDIQKQKDIELGEKFFSSSLNLKFQYDRIVESLYATGVLLGNVDLEIMGIDKEFYPVPSYEKILEVLIKKQSIIQEKISQGFTQLQLTPIATPIEILKDRYAMLLIKHKQENQLFATRKNPNDKPIPLDLDTTNPIYIYQEFINGEQSGDLIYYPQQFQKDNHGGLTKPELILKLQNSPCPGWNVLLLEDNAFLPQENQGKTINGRKQIENGKTPIDYLNLLQTQKPYHNESGLTIEDWLTQAILRLQTRDEVINDFNDGNSTFLIGNFLKEGFLPRGCWDRYRRACVIRDDFPGYRYTSYGVRSAVRG